MCGITGIVSISGAPVESSAARAMSETLTHRGPDDAGEAFYSFSGRPVRADSRDCAAALCHRRLSIIDLSPAGKQPMSADGTDAVIIHNGEVYNYVELREELAQTGAAFSTATDTEVILKAYAKWDADCLSRFNGMWAFAIYEPKERKFFAARDRFGIKPFYYAERDGLLYFASEIKALLAALGAAAPDERTVYDYLAHAFIDHTDTTFFAGIRQLPPGHALAVADGRVSVKRYYRLEPGDSAAAEDAPERFRELLLDSVRLRLRSDVAVGSCLSGGLDSSFIVCLINGLLRESRIESIGDAQKTISAIYPGDEVDESKFMKAVAEATAADAKFTEPKGNELLGDIEDLVYHQDEPFGSTSIYAQWKVFEAARAAGVTVMLDGQGADEMLAGYHPYFKEYWAALIKRGKLAKFLREISSYKALFGGKAAKHAAAAFAALGPSSLRRAAKRFAGLERDSLLGKNFRKEYGRPIEIEKVTGDSFTDYLYWSFTKSSLPGLLHYEDRNSMAFSIESRVPYLDYRLVEFAFGLPPEWKIDEGTTKVVLREAARGVIPEEVRTRTDKVGFATPEAKWFAGPARAWAEGILGSDSFRSRPWFDAAKVARAFEEKDASLPLWRFLNLELWMRRFVD